VRARPSSDDRFDIGRHVRVISCPWPGDEAALLAVAAERVTQRLPADRPLWCVQLVSGMSGGRTAMIFVLHHVLADGMGGLAILAQLVDGAPAAAASDYPRPAPSRGSLLLDALRARENSRRTASSGDHNHP
jgi:diacylglycerol O-acyltransferase